MSTAGGGAGRAMRTSLLFDLFVTNQAVSRMLATAMRDGPLNPSEYAIYSAIFELEAGTPTTIAARLGMPLTTLVDHLRTLEGRGHAARLPHPTDGRSYRVVLTAAGLEAHRAANAGFEAAHQAFTAGLPEGEDRARAGLGDIRTAAELAAEGRAAEAAASRRRSGGRAG